MEEGDCFRKGPRAVGPGAHPRKVGLCEARRRWEIRQALARGHPFVRSANRVAPMILRFVQLKLRAVLILLVRWFGPRLVDAHSGRLLGRAFVLPWRGRLVLIGYEGDPLRVEFGTQPRLTYWKQEILFTTPPAPDFPVLVPPASSPSPP